MRSMLLRTFFIAALLSVLAVATNVVLFARVMPMEAQPASANPSVQIANALSRNPEILHGFRVLRLIVDDPSMARFILFPQLALIFPFMWAAALMGARARGSTAEA